MPTEPGPLLAMVALSSERLPAVDTLRDAFAARQPEWEEATATGENGVLFFALDGEETRAFVALMPMPIPWDDLEGPCATAWWWDEATEAMQSHTHHVVVSLLGGEGDPVERHLVLTDLVATVTELTDAVGVYWGSGTVVHEPAAFRDAAADLTPDEVIPMLWIDLRIEPLDAGGYRFFTTGLAAFDQLEIEIDRFETDPDDLYEFLVSIVHYVLTSGNTIADGETIGRDADERIAATHEPSMFDRAGPVLKLGLT
jgi:hypothetical protein